MEDLFHLIRWRALWGMGRRKGVCVLRESFAHFSPLRLSPSVRGYLIDLSVLAKGTEETATIKLEFSNSAWPIKMHYHITLRFHKGLCLNILNYPFSIN